jgi:Tfp pilus assembly protein FimV
LVAVALVWAPFQQRVTTARTQAETAQQENESSRLRGDQLATRLATTEADLRRTQAAFEAKAAAVATQVSELQAVLTTAKEELAKRDARLAAGEAALVESRRDAQHFQEVAKAVSAQVAALTQQHQALATLLSQTEATIAAIRSPQLKVVDLAGGAQQPKAWARLFWDQQHNTWHLLATDLAPLPAGKVYELWFINAAQQKIAAGTFSVDAKGVGAVMAVIPPNIGVLTTAAVTDEPVGGVAAPTGSVQLVATL